MESIFGKKLAVRQQTALSRIPYYFRKAFSSLGTKGITGFIACMMAVFQLLGTVLSDSPMPVTDNELDLTGYECVFSDEFNGTQLDPAVWEESFPLGTGEIFDPSMVSFDGNNMIISTEYRTEGSKGAGWYTYGIMNTVEYMKFSTGYYEVRCKFPAAKGMWSAFWMMTEGSAGVNTVAQDTLGEFTEIDIMESFYYGEQYENSTINTVHHWIPEKQDYDSVRVGKYFIDTNPYEEYNTYGVMWTPDEFIFYINGKESGRTSNGATLDAARMLLTVQVDLREGSNTIGENNAAAFPADYVVDYVRVYQPA